MTNSNRFVTSRKTFFEQLDAAIAQTQQMIAEYPTWEMFQAFARQLASMKQWTKDGRKPSFEERKTIDLNTSRFLLENPVEQSLADYMFLIGELGNYFNVWRSDAGLLTLDDDDWKTDFPRDYDLSDE